MAIDSDRSVGDELLRNTPYLLGESEEEVTAFSRLVAKADKARDLARKAAEKVEHETSEILGQYDQALTADLVAESNRIEGYDWSKNEVEEAVRENAVALTGPIRDFVELIKSDPKLYEALGLYRAYTVAKSWSEMDARPSQAEIRQLHSVIMGSVHHAGKYKDHPNKIGGAEHEPPAPYDVPHMMTAMCDWFRVGTGNAVLDATVIHAWITHIHPFEDGNGRMARILANFALVNAGYPPFLIRSGSDRIEYYRALHESDHGNIQPLFALFTHIMRRTAKSMLEDDYVEKQLRSNYLNTSTERYRRWSYQVDTFFRHLESGLRPLGIIVDYREAPSEESYNLLEKRNSDGNCWASVISDDGGRECLLWFGYVGDSVTFWLGEGDSSSCYPSIYLSLQNFEPEAQHPFSNRIRSRDGYFNEVHLRPLEKSPVIVRVGEEVTDYSMHAGVRKITSDLKRYFS